MMVEEAVEVWNTCRERQKIEPDDASVQPVWDEVKEESGTSKFHKLGDSDYEETWYNTLTNVPLHSLLWEYIRAEKDDDVKPHLQSFKKDQPIEDNPSAKAVKTDHSKILIHFSNDWVV